MPCTCAAHSCPHTCSKSVRMHTCVHTRGAWLYILRRAMALPSLGTAGRAHFLRHHLGAGRRRAPRTWVGLRGSSRCVSPQTSRCHPSRFDLAPRRARNVKKIGKKNFHAPASPRCMSAWRGRRSRSSTSRSASCTVYSYGLYRYGLYSYGFSTSRNASCTVPARRVYASIAMACVVMPM